MIWGRTPAFSSIREHNVCSRSSAQCPSPWMKRHLFPQQAGNMPELQSSFASRRSCISPPPGRHRWRPGHIASSRHTFTDCSPCDAILSHATGGWGARKSCSHTKRQEWHQPLGARATTCRRLPPTSALRRSQGYPKGPPAPPTMTKTKSLGLPHEVLRSAVFRLQRRSEGRTIFRRT